MLSKDFKIKVDDYPASDHLKEFSALVYGLDNLGLMIPNRAPLIIESPKETKREALNRKYFKFEDQAYKILHLSLDGQIRINLLRAKRK